MFSLGEVGSVLMSPNSLYSQNYIISSIKHIVGLAFYIFGESLYIKLFVCIKCLSLGLTKRLLFLLHFKIDLSIIVGDKFKC